MREGFDNDKYIALQAEHIRSRINQFGGKLYLEFGGKLFDDYHASRVLPGFEPDSKFRMLKTMVDEVEIIIAINANHIEKSKTRGDLGITYDEEVLRLLDVFRSRGFATSGVVITHFENQPSAVAFRSRLDGLGIKSYLHYPIAGYPYDTARIVSDEGYGKNEFVETTHPLVVVTAPGPGSGKMATCLSQLYHEHKHGNLAGYAKYETFPIWNLPLKHPVNIAYEAATVDLDDANCIDPFHLEAYGKTTVNYNRDVEIFPVLKTMMERIAGDPAFGMTLPELEALLEKHGYEAVFYPHFEVQRFLSSFHTANPRVKIAALGEADVQTLLMESAVMVSDFSSVQFDFAYMKKPLLYYQFDEAQYWGVHHDVGYFSYRDDGFGPVVTEQAALFRELDGALAQNGTISPFYAKRVDALFDQVDDQNCARNYQAIVELLN